MTVGARRRSLAITEEGGFLGGLDALVFGALLFVTGTLLIVNVWSVVDTRMALAAAVREAARAVAEAPASDLWASADGGSVAVGRARERAARTLEQHGRPRDVLAAGALVVEAPALPARCAAITVSITIDAPTIGLPFVGAFTDGGFPVTVHHTETLDALRSGLQGDACV